MSADFEVHSTGTGLRLARLMAFEQCRLAPFYSPRHDRVALIAGSGEAMGSWNIEDARRFHDELAEALRLAACRDAPRSAVGGAA
jgi:hypothetical protein